MSTDGQTTPDMEYDRRPRHRQGNGVGSNGGWWAAIVATLVVGVVGGLVAGIQIGKGSTSSTVAGNSAIGDSQQMGGGFGMRGGTLGTVTAVSDASITVEDSRQSTTVTYTITDDTTVTDNGSTASVSDIAVGDTVMVQASSNSSSSSSSDDSTTQTATSIALNPSMQGGPGMQSSSSSSTD